MMAAFHKLSIIIPAYNEAKYILQVLKKVQKADCCGLQREIIIIDDGSTDETGKILKKYKKNNSGEIKIITKKINEGKGAAITDGLKKVTGDIVLIQDADLEYNPSYYPELLTPILKNKVFAVYGSRTLGIKEFGNKYSSRIFYLGGRILTELINWIYGTNLTDQPTGYKVFKKQFISILLNEERQKDFSFEVEITALLSKNNNKIFEVPISYIPRTIEEGKKIKAADFIKSLFIAISYRFK